MLENEHEGELIAIEGPDGCGKSTQVELLTEWMEEEGYDIIVTREPTDNPLGELLKKSLSGDLDLSLEAEALLFAGDRALHVSDFIRPNLEEGRIVLTERYVHSSLAYQTARGLPEEWVEEINRTAIEPDLSIFIDVPPEVGAERVNSSRESDSFDRDRELQKGVRNAYKKFAGEDGMPLIDGTESIEEVQDRIREEVESFLHADLR